MWIFGYGSLIWRVDFEYLEKRPASIVGWSRRFWQGSHDHRGTQDSPGRVVTLTPEAGSICLGMAYKIDHQVLDHLDHREKNGYERHELTLHIEEKAVSGTTYIATHDNHAFLGSAPIDEMVQQIVQCRGPSGANFEYLIELAQALRALGADDPHVFELEARVLDNLTS